MKTTPAGQNRCSERTRGSRRLLARAVLAAVTLAVVGRAQVGPPAAPDPVGQDPGQPLFADPVEALRGRPILAIHIADETRRGQAQEPAQWQAVIDGLETRVGSKFDPRHLAADCASLWQDRRLVARAEVRANDSGVEVTFYIDRRVAVYEGVEFRGLSHLDRLTVDSLLGIVPGRPVTSTEAEAMVRTLRGRYQREGFAFCSIRLQERIPDELDDLLSWPASGPAKPGERRRLAFLVDEGVRVTVRDVQVLGNTSFPASPALGVFGTGDYLLRESHIESDPAWGFARGGNYSRDLLENDLDRLRTFYRGRGFLDATVDLADVRFTADRSEVDLLILVVEGPRYRVQSIGVEFIDESGGRRTEAPLYGAAEVEAELKVKPGEFYDNDRLRRDWLAIQDFFGKRGHPAASFPGMARDPDAFRVQFPPRETYGEGAEVAITFLIFEGKPKKLRDVLIRGNQYTRDAVIRRRLRVEPGERIDMTQVQRGQRSLEQSRYFDDPSLMRGPRVQLEPVPGERELVDLAVDVQDGDTGELRWGIGISTGQGASASIVLNKRNFDLLNLPSSANPITVVSELLDNKAFHGGGQTLNTTISPGSRYSQFRVSWIEPDIFNDHYDTWQLNVAGHRLIRRLREGYVSDVLGGEVGLSRNLTDELNIGAALREDSVQVESLAADATSLAFDAEGQTELRGLRLSARYRDYDDLRRPTSGFEVAVAGEMVGGFLGGEESFTKFTHSAHWYMPLRKNDLGHTTYVHFEHLFGVANEFGGSDDVFLTERFHMGGGNLRGFNYHGAGPSQFNRALGGEATYTATLEINFPLVATRLEDEFRDRELLRWVVFTDVGFLGLGFDDPSFREMRGSSGVGLRIEVPYLEVPISLDLAWPWLYEETDDRRQFYFSISR